MDTYLLLKNPIIQFIGTFLIYYLLCQISHLISGPYIDIATNWLANPALLAIILLNSDKRILSYLIAGTLASAVVTTQLGYHPICTLVILACNNIEIIFIWLILSRHAFAPIFFDSITNGFKILITASFITGLILWFKMALIDVVFPYENFQRDFLSAFSYHEIAVFTVLPFGLSINRENLSQSFEKNRFLFFIALILITLSIELINYRYSPYSYVISTLPIIIAAFYLNILSVTFLNLISTFLLIHLRPSIIEVLYTPGRRPEILSIISATIIPLVIALLIQQRNRNESRIKESEKRFHNAMQYSAIGMGIANLEGKYLDTNEAFSKITGYSNEELSHLTFMDITYPDDLKKDLEEVKNLLAGKIDSYSTEKRYVRKDGSPLWVFLAVSLVRDNDEKPLYFISQVKDISQRKKAEQALTKQSKEFFEEKELLRITLQSIGDGVISTNTEGEIIFMNSAAENLLGGKMNDFSQLPIENILHLVNEAGAKQPDPIKTCLEKQKAINLADDTILINRKGKFIHIQATACPVFNLQKEITGTVLVFQDVSSKRELQKELTYQASHDALTGLLNRHQFEIELIKLMNQQSYSVHEYTLCYIDLDRFKVVNDAAGHTAGDLLLKEIARLLQDNVRSSDILGRLGGDEFGLILPDCNVQQAVRIAQKLIESIKVVQFNWEDHSYTVSASIGIAPFKPQTHSIIEILSQADIACYVAKKQGRNQVSVYNETDEKISQHHNELTVAAHIRDALENDRFVLYAQKIQSLKENSTEERYEVLIRMIDKEGNLVSPNAFIPAAERFDLMPDIDRWVIQGTIRECGNIILNIPNFYIQINLSANSINDPRFLDFLSQQLTNHSYLANRITFEITETAIINNYNASKEFIKIIQSLGSQVALDDFGNGFSSLNYLRQSKIDFVKIDGNIVRTIDHNHVDRVIVESINTIAKEIGAKTMAEYVENNSILEILAKMNVDYAQGNIIGAPVRLNLIFPTSS